LWNRQTPENSGKTSFAQTDEEMDYNIFSFMNPTKYKSGKQRIRRSTSGLSANMPSRRNWWGWKLYQEEHRKSCLEVSEGGFDNDKEEAFHIL
jgi:hypothetical protein